MSVKDERGYVAFENIVLVAKHRVNAAPPSPLLFFRATILRLHLVFSPARHGRKDPGVFLIFYSCKLAAFYCGSTVPRFTSDRARLAVSAAFANLWRASKTFRRLPERKEMQRNSRITAGNNDEQAISFVLYSGLVFPRQRGKGEKERERGKGNKFEQRTIFARTGEITCFPSYSTQA